MGIIKKAILLVIGWFTLKFIFTWIILLGLLSNFYNHHPGTCRVLPGIDQGSEDAQATSDGLLFVTSGMKHITTPDHPNFKDHVGNIMLVDTKAKKAQAVPLPIHGGLDRKTFSPHGISLWKDEQSGDQFVYVVNHRGDVDCIEKFLYDKKENVLKHLKSFTIEDFGLINDLLLVGLDQFYYTRWHYYRSRIGCDLERYLFLKFGGIGHFDGSKFSTVVSGLVQPNGINISPDHRYLYVAEESLRRIGVYQINDHNSLVEHGIIQLTTVPDNIEVNQNSGDLFVGCHPIPHKAIAYLDNPAVINSPSQVLHIKMSEGAVTNIEEIYYDDKLVSGSSVAVYVSEKLYVGTILHKMAECDVKYLS